MPSGEKINRPDSGLQRKATNPLGKQQPKENNPAKPGTAPLSYADYQAENPYNPRNFFADPGIVNGVKTDYVPWWNRPSTLQRNSPIAQGTTEGVETGPKQGAGPAVRKSSTATIQKKEGDIDVEANRTTVNHSLTNALKLDNKEGEYGAMYDSVKQNLSRAGMERILQYWNDKRVAPVTRKQNQLAYHKSVYEQAAGENTVTVEGNRYLLSGSPDTKRMKKNAVTQDDFNKANSALEAGELDLKQAQAEVPKLNETFLPFLASLSIDYFETQSDASFLDGYFDSRVEGVLAKYSAEMDASEMRKEVGVALEEVPLNNYMIIETGGVATGLVHFEGGGKVFHLGVNAFRSFDTIRATLEIGQAWKPTDAQTKSLDLNSSLGIDSKMKTKQQDSINRSIQAAIAENRARIQDIRALHGIQHALGAPISNEWDAQTVQYVAQSKSGVATKGSMIRAEGQAFKKGAQELSALAQTGVVTETDLREYFRHLVDQKAFTSAIILLSDFYDLETNIDALNMDADGNLLTSQPKQVSRPPAAEGELSVQPSQKTLGMHFTSQQSLDANTQEIVKRPRGYTGAFNTEGVEGMAPWIAIGSKIWAEDNAFDQVLYTLAHELVHAQQEIGNAPASSTLKEMNAERMELSRQFGNQRLPLKSIGSYEDDFDRALHELMQVDLDKPSAVVQAGIAIYSDLMKMFKARIMDHFGDAVGADVLTPKLVQDGYRQTPNLGGGTSSVPNYRLVQVENVHRDNLLWYEIYRCATLFEPFVLAMGSLQAEMTKTPTFTSANFKTLFASQIAIATKAWDGVGADYGGSGVPVGFREDVILGNVEKFIADNPNNENVKQNAHVLKGNAKIYSDDLKAAAKNYDQWKGAAYVGKWKAWLDSK